MMPRRRRELDDTTIKRINVIVANSTEQAIHDEQADLFDPVQAGFLSREAVGELGQLKGAIPGRTSARANYIFKTARAGVADVAVDSKICSLGRCHGIGMEF